MAREKPDLSLLDDVVASTVLDAMRLASAQLARLSVRHALVGGLAVGAYGCPRATKDVDFLVGDEAFEHHPGGLVTMKYGVPIQVRGVVVDFLSAKATEPHLQEALGHVSETVVPVVPREVLVYLKLKSPRPKDLLDVLELIRAGVPTDEVAGYLGQHAPELVSKWEKAVAMAWTEDEK